MVHGAECESFANCMSSESYSFVTYFTMDATYFDFGSLCILVSSSSLLSFSYFSSPGQNSTALASCAPIRKARERSKMLTSDFQMDDSSNHSQNPFPIRSPSAEVRIIHLKHHNFYSRVIGCRYSHNLQH